MILKELKKLYAHHAPQLKPRKRQKNSNDGGAAATSSAVDENEESIDPIEDMYNILEGSALIPFIVVSLISLVLNLSSSAG